jgi:RNA recognition motif-containing protein
LKSDVNVDNEHFDRLSKQLKSKDGEISHLKQKTIELIKDLKWANMLGSPLHIFNLEPDITNDFLEYKFSENGTVKKVYMLQNPPT